jgi:hypothetical protein
MDRKPRRDVRRMTSDRVKEHTRSDWRELGFFYELDEKAKEWRFVGSRAGLFRFAALLREYVNDPRNAQESEHEHYGPYLYLKVMTAPAAGIDGDSIHGSVSDLARLAALLEEKLAGSGPGSTVRISEEFVPRSAYDLVLRIRANDFDPASADQSLVD